MDPPRRDLDLTVVAVTGDSVTLETDGEESPALESDKVYGLDWDGGYGHVEELQDVDGEAVTRSFTLLEGDPPRAAPAHADDGGARLPLPEHRLPP